MEQLRTTPGRRPDGPRQSASNGDETAPVEERTDGGDALKQAQVRRLESLERERATGEGMPEMDSKGTGEAKPEPDPTRAQEDDDA